MHDYVIVGFGLAGLSFAEQLRKNDKSFVVINDNSQQSSRVAGGLYNPVILKRFTMAWNAHAQLREAVAFYTELESYLNVNITTPLRVLRRFNTIEEQNTWMQATDKPKLHEFLSPKLIPNTNTALDVPYQFGEVLHTGRISIEMLLDHYMLDLKKHNALLQESFEYNALEINKKAVSYKNVKAKHLVFCEGYGMLDNPYFNYLPLVGNKGEYIVIKSIGLKLKEAVKSSIFILPLGDDLYKIGATYNNQDKSSLTTQEARMELEKKLKNVLKVDYTIVDQIAGVRPTTIDRKPLVGTHPIHKNMHLLNGFGSRGVLIGPTVAAELYRYIEEKTSLDPVINISRFD